MPSKDTYGSLYYVLLATTSSSKRALDSLLYLQLLVDVAIGLTRWFAIPFSSLSPCRADTKNDDA